MMTLTTELEREGGAVVVVVRGEVDVAVTGELTDALREAIGEGGRRVVVDLESVDFIDSAGLGVLVAGLKRARTRGGDLALVATGVGVTKVLEITGLQRIIEVHETREAALAR